MCWVKTVWVQPSKLGAGHVPQKKCGKDVTVEGHLPIKKNVQLSREIQPTHSVSAPSALHFCHAFFLNVVDKHDERRR